ncbi:hypothetical protein BASA81_010030 [Batrachochytrium salamandrivorans]|nr:hypothetical protein BASA81_010030 [Batrachochytrium salamandrivorans]
MANHEEDASSVPESLFGNVPFQARGGGDDATSVAASLFGHMPPPSVAPSTVAASAIPPSPSQQQQDSYVDFYASLGSDRRNLAPPQTIPSSAFQDDLETSLLAEEGDAEHGRRFAQPLRRGGGRSGLPTVRSATWFTDNRSLVNLLVITAAVVFTVAIVYWIVESAADEDGMRLLLWRQPYVYQVSFVLTLSTASGMQEPGLAMVDELTGQQRVSFWNGMSTFIYTKQGMWSIIPRLDKLMCLHEPANEHLVPVFPSNLRKFVFRRQIELTLAHPPRNLPRNKKKQTVTCDEWHFSSLDRESDGYFGDYSFYTVQLDNGKTVPVRFEFVGRNVILNGAHYDNYTVDYYGFGEIEDQKLDESWVTPPKGMPCHEATDSMAGQVQAAYSRLFTPESDLGEGEYTNFRLEHGSMHPPSDERRGLFLRTKRLVDAHNRDSNSSYVLGMNFMADWTPQERQRQTFADDVPATCFVDHFHHTDPLTDKVVDHVAGGLVLPPEGHGTCGSNWAFAAVGAVEGQIAKQYAHHPPVALSAQNIIDCAWTKDTWYAKPCHDGASGRATHAYEWMINHNHGQVATSESYPFLNQVGFCHFDAKRELISDGAKALEDVKGVAECYHVTNQFQGDGSNQTTEELVAYFNYKLGRIGPLAVEVDVSVEDFYFYKSGVYSNPACKSGAKELNYAMLAVGYDLNDPVPFTKVRSNWGSVWGEGGYARVAQKDNICGVATAATYVLLDPKTHRPTTAPVPAPVDSTASPVEPPSEPPTNPPSEPPTNPPSEPPTNPPSEPPTNPPSEPPTNPPSNPPSEPPTDVATRAPVTFAPTDVATRAPMAA